MAKVSWSDFTPIANADGTPIAASAPKQVSWSDFTPIPQHYSFAHNVSGQFGNEFNSFINSGASQMQAIDQSLLNLHHKLFGGAPQTQPSQQLPIYPTSGTWEKLVGSGLALAVPYTGVEKALGLGMEAAKFGTPALEKVPAVLQKMFQSGGAMGATSFGTTQGNVRHRLASAALAAPLGIAGAGLGALAKPTGRAAKEIFGHAVAPLQRYIDASLQRVGSGNAESTLGTAYQTAQDNATWKNIDPLMKEADKSLKKSVPQTAPVGAVPKELQDQWAATQKLPSGGERAQAQMKVYQLGRKKYAIEPAQLVDALGGGEGQAVATAPPVSTFDPRSYTTEAQKVLKMAQKDEADDPDTYMGIGDKIQTKIDRAPTSFSDAVLQKKAINQMPASWERTTNDAKVNRTRFYAGKLGAALDKNVEENATTPEAQAFLKEWNTQRANHAALQQFYKDPNSAAFSVPIKNDLEHGNFEKVVKRYVPTVNESSAKINKLGDLVGDHEAAQNLLLRKGLESFHNKAGDIDAFKLSAGLNQNKISPALKNLLTPDEKSALTHIVGAKAMEEHLRANPTLLKRLSQHPFWTGGGVAALAHYAKLPIEGIVALSTAGMVVPRSMVSGGVHRSEAKAEQMLQRGELEKLGMLGKTYVPPKSGPVDRSLRALMYGTGVGATNQPVAGN